jgi:parallel beta-helix repeat protein
MSASLLIPAHSRASRLLRSALAGALLGACTIAAPAWAQAVPTASESVPSTCSKVASPQGSASGTGSVAEPLRTAQELAAALAPGQVGCLRAGTYTGGLTVAHGGVAGAPIVLRSYPGERAQITGRVYIPEGSNYVTIADLNLDGNHQAGSETLPSPTVDGDHATFEGDAVTDEHTEICFAVGSASWGVANATVIANNHIYDCGLLPSRNQDHGIYVDDATDTRIVGNLIDHNTDRGIQLYPDSSGAVITDNVISENGEGVIFSGDGGVASSYNVVEHNLIVDSLIRGDIESWYPSGNPVGVGNVAQENCVSSRGIDTGAGGFSAQGNITVGPAELLATEAGGYRPAADSACAGVVPALVGGLPMVEGVPSSGAGDPVGESPPSDPPVFGGEAPALESTAPASTAPPSGQGAPAPGSTAPSSGPAAPADGSGPGQSGGRARASFGSFGSHMHRARRVTARAAGMLARAAQSRRAKERRRLRARHAHSARRRAAT